MRNFLHIALIALANNVDNIGVRIAYSLKGITVPHLLNAWISVITFSITFLAAYSGTVLTGTIGKRGASIIAMALLTTLGLAMIVGPHIHVRFGKRYLNMLHAFFKQSRHHEDTVEHIRFKEATFLGIALSINNIGGGVGAGMIGLDCFWVAVLSAVLSFVAISAGNRLAELLARWGIAKKAPVVAGILLIAIGIEQIL